MELDDYLMWSTISGRSKLEPRAKSNEVITIMLRFLSAAAIAASIWTAALTISAPALAKESADAAAADTSEMTAASARAASSQPVRRVRRTNVQPRRYAAVAVPPPYYSQCFLFWCPSAARSYSYLMLGVGF